MSTHLIAGCGYLGMRVARKWLADGHQVAALTRSHERAGHFAEIGLTPIIGDITEPKSLRDVPAATTILFAVGFDRQAGPSIEEVYVNGLATFLDAIRQIGSSISVRPASTANPTVAGWTRTRPVNQIAQAGKLVWKRNGCYSRARLLINQ